MAVLSQRLRAEVHLARAQLAALVRSRCADLRRAWQREAGQLQRPGLGAFEARVLRQAGRAADEVAAAAAERFGEAARRAGLTAAGSRDVAAPPFRPPPPRRWPLEDRLSAVLGAGFGLGVSLTAGRVLAGWGAAPEMLIGCGGIGLSLAWWVVGTRRLLSARAGTERWAAEVAAALRATLEELVLAAESDLMSRYPPSPPVSGRRRPLLSDTPDYRRL